MKKLKVKELNKENFANYGTIIEKPNIVADADEPTHKWWGGVASLPAEGDINVGLMEAKKRSYNLGKLEKHKKSAEMLIALEGNSIIVIGTNKKEDLNAFYIKQGSVLVLNKEILHWVPFPNGENAYFAVIFRDETPNDDLEFIELEEKIKLVL